MRLEHGKRVAAGDGHEEAGSFRARRGGPATFLVLVGADGELGARRLEAIERRHRPLEWTAADGEILPVIVEEALQQPLALLLRELGGIGTQGMLDHKARAVPDQRPESCSLNARQAETGEYVVGRGNEVGSGVDQRAVEIEDEGERRA